MAAAITPQRFSDSYEYFREDVIPGLPEERQDKYQNNRRNVLEIWQMLPQSAVDRVHFSPVHKDLNTNRRAAAINNQSE
jgi:hypothetical protein